MIKNDESRIDKWIDSRLENLKEEGRTISTDQILIELQSLFKIKIKNENIWKMKILKFRNRINKRFERRKTFSEDLAKELVLPVELIQRWIKCGWIIPTSENRKQCLGLFREFEYYRRFKPEVIPQDKPGYSIAQIVKNMHPGQA